MDTTTNQKNLSKYLTPFNTWALTFGCCIGWGSFVMPGTAFLPTAGPVGTALAMLAAAVIMIVIAANYHYMINRKQDAGGTFAYTKNIFGYDHAFLCAWFLWLAYVALIWANATAFVLIGRNLLGNFFQFGFHYTLGGYDIYFGEIIFTVFVLLIFGLLSVRKKFFVMKLNTILAAGFLIFGLSCTLLVIGKSPNPEIFSPPFAFASSPLAQITSIVTLAPWAFIGFETISHASEEFNFPAKKTFKIMTLAIISAAIFYTAMNFLAVSNVPKNFSDWEDYVSHLGELQGLEALPTFNAVNSIFGSAGVLIFGLTVVAALSTSLIGYYFVSSRLTYAAARENILPESLAKLNSDGVPQKIIFSIMILSFFIPFIGRTAISWLTDITTIGATIAYGYTSVLTYLTARDEGNKKFKITGALGLFFSIIFAFFLLFPNFWAKNILATESYLILVFWSVMAFLFSLRIFNGDEGHRFGKSVLTWIIILFFIFFGSLMWVRQSADERIESVVSNMSKFYGEELANFGVKFHDYQKLKEEYYLKKQMEEVRTSLFINSMLQMVLILFSLYIMFSIYSAMRSRERNAELAKMQAEESSRAKTNFLSNMSHDIRTPMNAIIGYTNLARREGVTFEEVQEFLVKIGNSSQHLLSLINDVLEMSRIESGKMELDNSPVDLKKIFSDIEDMFTNQMHEKKINFVVDSSKIKNRHVLCDKNRLNRILLNLTSNAYKFTPEGGKISLTLTQKNFDEEKNFADYELRVKDSGIGMSEEFAKTVFEPFTRERTSTVSGIQGTGLGMAITKSIVDLMNGNIQLETSPNKGTEFILNVRFELFEDVSEEVEEISKTEETPENNFAAKKILLVEDIEVNREIALMILTEAGFEVETAVDGKDAVEKISASKPGDFDAILMDIQMPIMNGYEATKKIRRLENKKLSTIPIIAMTANAFNEDIQVAKDAGMNDHIAKPIDIPKMLETLNKFLN